MLRLIAAVLLLATATPASAMTVATFLSKADGLKKKGPLALLSGDVKLLMNQVKVDSEALRAERQAAEAAGTRRAYCPPPGGVKMGQEDVLAAMEAVPPAERPRTSTKDALRAYLARRHPCAS